MARSTHLEKGITNLLDQRISNLEDGVNVIDNNAVDNAALADMAAGTVKGNLGGSAADPTDVTLADLAAALIADTETGSDDLWSAQKIANEINLANSSSLKYKGGYDAAASTPNLTTGAGVKVGDTYTVTTPGTFNGVDLEVGDFLIAEVDDPVGEDDWTIVQANIGKATTTTHGLVELATDGEAVAGVAVQGNDARLSDSRTPTGTAGGDLTGSYPNPTIGDDKVVTSKIADGNVTLAKIEDVPAQTILGNNTGAADSPVALTPTQIRSLINVEDNAAADQLASEVPVTATGDLTSTNVQDALVELQGDIDTLDSVSHNPVTISDPSGPLSVDPSQALSIREADKTITETGGISYFNGVISAVDKQKLDNIEDNAKDDQNATEVPYTGSDGDYTEADTNVAAALGTLNSVINNNENDITVLENEVVALQADTHVKAVSGNAGITVDDTTQAVSAVVSTTADNKLSIDANGLFVNQTAADVSVTDNSGELGSTDVQGALDKLSADLSVVQTKSHDAVTLSTDPNGLTLTDQELGLDLATTSSDGAMSSADKTKLDNMGGFLDEDDFASDSDTQAPTQQSAKAYIEDQLLVRQMFNGGSHDLDTIAPVQGRIYLIEAYSGTTFTSSKNIYIRSPENLNGEDQGTNYTVPNRSLFFLTNAPGGMSLINLVNSVLDEDDMASNSDYALATQRSIKAYVDRDSYSSNIARLTNSGPYTFSATGPKYLHFFIDASTVGTLPSSPVIGQHYVIKNSASSLDTLTVNSVVVAPGDIYEIIYDGVEWVEY